MDDLKHTLGLVKRQLAEKREQLREILDKIRSLESSEGYLILKLRQQDSTTTRHG